MATDSRTPGKQLVEEYRYDALGRRVWVSTRWRCAPSADFGCVANAVTRTIWDGASEVAEIRAQYDTSTAATEELDSGAPLVPKSIVGDANPFYGRVVYGPGLAVDQPLSVTRFDYRDNPYQADALAWPTFTIMPFWDYRGTPVFGLYSDGTYWKPYGPSSSGSCASTPGSGTTNRCVYLTWPFAGSAYHQDRGLLLTYSWHGSLLLKKKDVSGLTYARNRMYDPQTGRFTQEDPIGLAGGLNAYGFASGDPVNYSDPFGLCPDANGVERGRDFCPGGQGLHDVSVETAIFFSGVFGIVRSGIAAGFAALSRSLAPKVAGVAEEAIARRVSAAGLNKVETEVLRRFFRSGGKELQGVSEDVLLKYRRVAEEAMLGAGGKRVTETVLRVQTERIRLIDEALRALKQ